MYRSNYRPADGDGDGACRRRRALRADLHQTLVVVAETVEPGVGDLCPPVAVSLLFIRCIHTALPGHTGTSGRM